VINRRLASCLLSSLVNVFEVLGEWWKSWKGIRGDIEVGYFPSEVAAGALS
jgi:hypothetical protein